MYIYVALDWQFFKFFPLEADVFIDISGRSKKERENFKQIQDYIRNHPEIKLSVY